jgi:hypothetical protein
MGDVTAALALLTAMPTALLLSPEVRSPVHLLETSDILCALDLFAKLIFRKSEAIVTISLQLEASNRM